MKTILSRLLALLLLLLVPLLAWYAVGEPLHNDYLKEQQKIARDLEFLHRFESISARFGEYRTDLARQRQDTGLQRAMLQAQTETLAAAILQQRVKSVVESKGGSLVSTQILEPLALPPLEKIRINVRMLLNIPQLQQVLHDIEGQMPYLIVEQLLVTNRNWRGRSLNVRGKAAENLDVRLVISGYWHTASVPAKAG